MIRRNPSGHLPVVHNSAFVDPTASLCGKVIDEDGKMEAIVIGANSNIQDGLVIHCKAGGGVTIGRGSKAAKHHPAFTCRPPRIFTPTRNWPESSA